MQEFCCIFHNHDETLAFVKEDASMNSEWYLQRRSAPHNLESQKKNYKNKHFNVFTTRYNMFYISWNWL